MPARWHTREDSGIRLDRQFRWWHDGELIEHPNIIEAFNKGVRVGDDGRVTLHFGPVDALEASLKKLPEGVMLIGKILAKLPTGEVPLESMGGPLQIAQVASQTAAQGLDAFLSAMALVSVNLALVNLLPIPILDGFNILIAIWEAIRRRPPSMRARELTTYFGFAVLAVLMIVAFRNDIARLLFC